MKKLELLNPEYRLILKEFTEWLKTLGYSESSLANLPNHAKEFLHWLEMQEIQNPSEIESNHCKQFMEYLNERGNARKKHEPLSEAHLAKFLQSLKLLSKYFRQSGIAGFDAGKGIIQPRRKVKECLTKIEIKSLYESCSQNTYGLRDRAMLAVFYGCGLRRNEGCFLDMEDVLIHKNLLYVRNGKGRKERYVPMGAKVQEDLENYIEKARPLLMPSIEEKALFLNHKGKRLGGGGHAKRIEKLCEKAEIEKKCSLHTLRHSIATHLLQNGLPMRQVGEFLGHATLEATQIYTHLNTG
jgi:integrase/recombinase XerD